MCKFSENEIVFHFSSTNYKAINIMRYSQFLSFIQASNEPKKSQVASLNNEITGCKNSLVSEKCLRTTEKVDMFLVFG